MKRALNLVRNGVLAALVSQAIPGAADLKPVPDDLEFSDASLAPMAFEKGKPEASNEVYSLQTESMLEGDLAERSLVFKKHEPAANHTARADFIFSKIMEQFGYPVIPSNIIKSEEGTYYLAMPNISEEEDKTFTGGYAFSDEIKNNAELMSQLAGSFVLFLWSMGSDVAPKNFFWSADGKKLYYYDFGAGFGSKAKGGAGPFLPEVWPEDFRILLTDHNLQKPINPAFAGLFVFDSLKDRKIDIASPGAREILKTALETFKKDLTDELITSTIKLAYKKLPADSDYAARIQALSKMVDTTEKKDRDSEAQIVAAEKQVSGQTLTSDEQARLKDKKGNALNEAEIAKLADPKKSKIKRLQFEINDLKNTGARNTIKNMAKYKGEEEFLIATSLERKQQVIGFMTELLNQ